MSLLSTTKKGKWIIGGALVFGIIATATTGLASWVIATSNGANINGQITVATIQDKSIELSNVAIVSGQKFVFGPSSDDTTGMIQSSGSDTESLSVKVTGTIKAGQTAEWTNITGTFAIDTTKNSEDSDAVTTYNKLITGNYIVAPTVQTVSKPSDFNGTYSFEMTFTFAWGTAIGEENPSLYFDDETKGTVEKTYDKALALLNDLQKLNNLNYVITVSAN